MPSPARWGRERDGSSTRLQWKSDASPVRRVGASPAKRAGREKVCTHTYSESPLRSTPTPLRTPSRGASPRTARTDSPRVPVRRPPRCDSPHSPKGASGIALNNADLKSIRPIARENPNLEFLYLRENNFSDFDPWQPLEQLKVLDLSLNGITSCEFLWDYEDGKRVSRLPNLHHLYLTGNALVSMRHFDHIPHLETLTLSSNAITTFEGLQHLERLRVLSLHHNDVETLRYFPRLPSLNTLNLIGNPVSRHPFYRVLVLALCPPDLAKIDSKEVTEEERIEASKIEGKLRHAILEGFLPLRSSADWEADAENFILTSQQLATATGPLQLLAIDINKVKAPCVEGDAVELCVCLKDVRVREHSHTRVFQSEYIVPMEFRVKGDAEKVHLMTNLNGWAPVEMAKDQDGEHFSVTLYVTPGVCLYKYVVDEEEIIDEPAIEHEGALYTVIEIPEAPKHEADDGDNLDSILHIRWLRSDPVLGWLIIDNENTSVYTPTAEDIGRCLRVEILNYLEGEYQSQVYHLSNPVEPGPPTVTLTLEGRAIEGSDLILSATYTGGTESGSVVRWYKEGFAGRTLLSTDDPRLYRLMVEDIGERIVAVYTPCRDGRVMGDDVEVTSEVVTPLPPTASNPRLKTPAVEGQPLVVDFDYQGGFPGQHEYSWRRWDDRFQVFIDDDSAVGCTFVPTTADVGGPIEVYITPVASSGAKGRPVTLETPPVAAALPCCKNVRFSGDCKEGQTLKLLYTYTGGEEGTHTITWEGESSQRRPDEYRVTVADVGKTVKACLLPCRSDGTVGKLVEIESPVIEAGVPRVEATVVGEPKENSVLHVDAVYSGGIEGDSEVEWGRALGSGRYEWFAEGTSLALTECDVGHTMCVRYLPVRDDGKEGKVVIARTQGTVKPEGFVDDGSSYIVKVWIEGESEAGAMLTGFYELSDPTEEKVDYQWLRSDGTVLGTKRTLIPTGDDLGQTVKFGAKVIDSTVSWRYSSSTEEIREEVLVVTFPEDVVEGDVLQDLVNRKHKDAVYEWKVSHKNDFKIVGDTERYVVAKGDVGRSLYLTCEVPATSFGGEDSRSQAHVVPLGCVSALGADVDGQMYWRAEIEEADVLTSGTKLTATHKARRGGVTVDYSWDRLVGSRWQNAGKGPSYAITHSDLGSVMRLVGIPSIHREDTPFQQGTRTTVSLGTVRRAISKRASSLKRSMSKTGSTSRHNAATPPRPASRTGSARGRQAAPQEKPLVRTGSSSLRPPLQQVRSSSFGRSAPKKSPSLSKKGSSKRPPSCPPTPDRGTLKRTASRRSEISLDNIPTVQSAYRADTDSPASEGRPAEPEVSFSSIQHVPSVLGTPQDNKDLEPPSPLGRMEVSIMIGDDEAREHLSEVVKPDEPLTNEADALAIAKKEKEELEKDVNEAEKRARVLAEAKALEDEAQQEADEILAAEEAAGTEAPAPTPAPVPAPASIPKKPGKKKVRVTVPSERRTSLKRGSGQADGPPSPDTPIVGEPSLSDLNMSPPRLSGRGTGPCVLQDTPGLATPLRDTHARPAVRERSPPSSPKSPKRDSSPVHVQLVPSFTSISFTCGPVAHVSTPIPALTHYKGGGVEGRSVLQWQKRYPREDWMNLDTPEDYTYCGTADDAGCQFRVAARPVNIEGLSGEICYSEPIAMKWADITRGKIVECLSVAPSFAVLLDNATCVLTLDRSRLQVRYASLEQEPFIDVELNEEHGVGVKVVGWETEFDLILITKEKGFEMYSFSLDANMRNAERDFLVLLIRVWCAVCDYDACKKYLGRDIADTWSTGYHSLLQADKEELMRSAFRPWQPCPPGRPHASNKGENIRALQTLLCL